ncbi:MAG: hypothetical protein WBN28_08290 [Lutimonas sp.]|jgi:hypothetical protein
MDLKEIVGTKKTLFTGIILLVLGIVLKKTTGLAVLPIALMICGVLLKTFYIIRKAQTGEYKPGYELLFLFIGLALFFTGIYLRKADVIPLGQLLFFTGIGLKIVFIILFIKKVRSQRMLGSSG